jgi:uncharacterized delta-60 repeat protein
MTLGGTGQVNEGDAYNLTLGAVSDPNPNDVVKQYTVNWGDNSSNTYTESDLSYSNRTVQHTYTTAGAHQISVDLTEQSVFLDPSFNGGRVTYPFSPGKDGGLGVAVDPTDGSLVVVDAQGVLWRYNADGTPNASFGQGAGWASAGGIFGGVYPQAVAIDSYGNILTAGSAGNGFLVQSWFSVGNVPNGRAFGNYSSSEAVVDFGTGSGQSAEGIVLDTQGRINLVGSIYNPATRGQSIGLARLMPTGQLDPTFGGGSGKVTLSLTGNDAGLNLAIDRTTGNLVVLASTSSGERLVRFTSNGTLDTSFGAGTGWVPFDSAVNTSYSTQFLNASPPRAISIDPAGRIFIGGNVSVGAGFEFAVACYNADGTRNASFAMNGVASISVGSTDERVFGLTVDAAGNILLVGSTINPGNGDTEIGLARLTSMGAADVTFGNGTGAITRDVPNGQSFGEAVAADPTTGGLVQLERNVYPVFGNYLVRYHPDGTLDTNFGNGTGRIYLPPTLGSQFSPYGQNSLAIDQAGKILVSGDGSSGTIALTRFNADGSLDTSFGTNGTASPSLSANIFIDGGLTVDAQGRMIIVINQLDSATNTWTPEFARLTSSGTLDTSFGNGTGTVAFQSPSSEPLDAFIAENPTTGDLVVVTNGQSLARYHADGSIDTTFGNGSGSVAVPGAGLPIVDASGRIVLFTGVGLLRYNSDGSLDQTFGMAGTEVVDLAANGMAMDSQGRIVLSGSLGYGFFGYAVALERFNVVTPDGPFLGAGIQSVTVQDATPTAGISTPFPTDANNNPTAPVGTLLTFSGSFSDNPIDTRALTNTDTVSWAVTLNGQPYSLPTSTVTNGQSFSFTPTVLGNYVVSLTVADPDGGTATAQQALDITSMDANSLQNLVNFQASYANPYFNFQGSPPTPVALTIQADPTQVDAAVAALNALVQPQVFDNNNFVNEPVAVTVTLNLTSGNYSDLNFGLQPPVIDPNLGTPVYVTAIVNGVKGSTTVVGHSPALTITSGNVTVNSVIFMTATDAPTILVASGSLALRNDVVQESTGFADAAIAVTSGSVDLGSTADLGNNIININGAGQPVLNTTSTPISTAGNTFESGGTVLPGALFSTATVTSSAATTMLKQSVTFTATVQPSGTGTPTGTVDFFDVSSNTDLGSVTLSGGTASITTTALSAGSNIVQARYGGDATFLPSLGSTAVSVLYKFGGFLSPLNSNMALALNRTVPIKFQLTDYNNKFISNLSAVASLQVLNSSGTNVLTNTGSTALRYDTTANQFVANWQTKGLAAGTYTVTLVLADGTTYTKSVTLSKTGSASGLTTTTAGGTTTAVGALLGGDIDLYVDNTNGDLTADELARIQDAVTAADAVTEPYGVAVVEVSDPTLADVTLNMDTTSAVGGYADGVLGCTTDAGQITIINGWNFYAGSNAASIGSGQYDFETVVTHELGHALGLGHSTDSTSVMYATLNTGTVNRSLTTADLNVADTGTTGACGLHAAALLGRTSNPSDEDGRDAFFAQLSDSLMDTARVQPWLISYPSPHEVFANPTGDFGPMLSAAGQMAINASPIFAVVPTGMDSDPFEMASIFPSSLAEGSNNQLAPAAPPSLQRDAGFAFIPADGSLGVER